MIDQNRQQKNFIMLFFRVTCDRGAKRRKTFIIAQDTKDIYYVHTMNNSLMDFSLHNLNLRSNIRHLFRVLQILYFF